MSSFTDWLRGISTSARKHPFVFVAMLTAFPYTAWCAANVLHGVLPADDSARTLYWLTAVLFATTIDIGAVSASSRLSERWTFVDFLSFCLMVGGMWYVQTLYALIHYAPLEVSSAIPSHMRQTAETLRDLAVWLMPVFIPAPLVINALRGLRNHPRTNVEAVPSAPPVDVVPITVSAPVLPDHAGTPPRISASGAHTGEASGYVIERSGRFQYTCPKCGKQDDKDTRDAAQAALNVHLGRWCPARKTVEVVPQDVG